MQVFLTYIPIRRTVVAASAFAADVFRDLRNPIQPTAAIRDMGPDAGTYRYLLCTLGHDYGLKATTGYDMSSGWGRPAPSYLEWLRRHDGRRMSQ